MPQDKALYKDDIGIENARPEDIREAIYRAKPMKKVYKETFTKADMIRYGMTGASDAAGRREKMAEALGIGHGNGKQFLQRLNSFGISVEEFERIYEEVFGG